MNSLSRLLPSLYKSDFWSSMNWGGKGAGGPHHLQYGIPPVFTRQFLPLPFSGASPEGGVIPSVSGSGTSLVNQPPNSKPSVCCTGLVRGGVLLDVHFQTMSVFSPSPPHLPSESPELPAPEPSQGSIV